MERAAPSVPEGETKANTGGLNMKKRLFFAMLLGQCGTNGTAGYLRVVEGMELPVSFLVKMI